MFSQASVILFTGGSWSLSEGGSVQGSLSQGSLFGGSRDCHRDPPVQ